MKKTTIALSAALLAVSMAHAPVARAVGTATFNATYYKIYAPNVAGGATGVCASAGPSCTSTVADFYPTNVSYSTGRSYNYVMPTLGPNGLPVFNSAFTTTSGTVNPVSSSSKIAATGEINWWRASSLSGGNAAATVATGGSPTMSFSGATVNNMFAPGTTSDATYFAADVLTGYFYLNTAQTFSFLVGSDDSAFIYIDGTLAVSEGGINGAVSPGDSFSKLYAAGKHTVQVFYVDRAVTAAAMFFNVTGGPNITASVPEPGMLSLLGLGFAGLIGMSRRKRRLG